MLEIDRNRAAATLRRSSPVFVLAVGFLLGVLVAVAVVPDHTTSTTRAVTRGRGATSADVGAGEESALGGDDAVGPDGTVDAAAGDAGDGTPGGAGASAAGSAGGRAAGTVPALPATEASAQRGVTAQKIRIGIGLPDISVIAALGPGYDQGDIRAHVEGVLAALHRDKKLPVAGRDIEPVFRTYNILSQDEQRAACVGFGQDDKVFAVIAIHDFGIGSECVSAEYHTPLITADGPYDASYRRGWPYLFTMAMSSSRVIRNLVAWGHHAGRFTGKRIGVYYANDPITAPDVQTFLIKRLRALGHQVVAEVTTDLQTANTGGPNDSVAVQRFRAARVDTAILFVSPVAKTNFFNQAQLQGYRPMYLETDLAFSTTSTGTKTYNSDYFDGMVGVTGQRFGEAQAGIPPTPESDECLAQFKAHTGRQVDRAEREAEYIAGNQVCDEFRVLMTALRFADRNLTPARFIAGLETVKNARMGIHGDVTFSPTRHDGVNAYRELLWRKSCRCWVAQGPFKPLASP